MSGRMYRSVIHIAYVVAALVALLAPNLAFATDQGVDYTAPYLTLENGVLVTKYPSLGPNHPATKPATTAPSAAEPFTASPVESGWRTIPIAAAAIVAAAIVALIVVPGTLRGARRRQIKPTSPAAAGNSEENELS